MKVNNKGIIKLYYTALMTFLVFTFAHDLLRGIIEYGGTEYTLFMIFWVALVIQTTFAYRHIMAIKQKKYTVLILVSDCIDVALEVFVCAVISSTYTSAGIHELSNYKWLSIPFMILAVNQVYWYISIKERNPRAIIRLIILFVGMLTVTILESIDHNTYNLAFFVIVHAFSMAILRAFDETRQNGLLALVILKNKKCKDDHNKDKDTDINPIDKQ